MSDVAKNLSDVAKSCSNATGEVPGGDSSGSLGYNVCSNFHEDSGILKPIWQNHDIGVYLT